MLLFSSMQPVAQELHYIALIAWVMLTVPPLILAFDSRMLLTGDGAAGTGQPWKVVGVPWATIYLASGIVWIAGCGGRQRSSCSWYLQYLYQGQIQIQIWCEGLGFLLPIYKWVGTVCITGELYRIYSWGAPYMIVIFLFSAVGSSQTISTYVLEEMQEKQMGDVCWS